MDDILNRPIVLVLNRNWQAINVRTPQQAFVQMATDVATALDIDGENMVPVRWAQWIKLPVRENDYAVRTPSGLVRIPHAIVLSRFAKVPKRRPKFSGRGIWARDGGRCQYTGKPLRAGEGNIHHAGCSDIHCLDRTYWTKAAPSRSHAGFRSRQYRRRFCPWIWNAHGGPNPALRIEDRAAAGSSATWAKCRCSSRPWGLLSCC
ncbi:MAG: hypothetical protein WDO13_06530 [Verrucomicrobiota bacterium]